MQEDLTTRHRSERARREPPGYLDRPIGFWPTDLVDSPIPYALSPQAGAALDALDSPIPYALSPQAGAALDALDAPIPYALSPQAGAALDALDATGMVP